MKEAQSLDISSISLIDKNMLEIVASDPKLFKLEQDHLLKVQTILNPIMPELLKEIVNSILKETKVLKELEQFVKLYRKQSRNINYKTLIISKDLEISEYEFGISCYPKVQIKINNTIHFSYSMILTLYIDREFCKIEIKVSNFEAKVKLLKLNQIKEKELYCRHLYQPLFCFNNMRYDIIRLQDYLTNLELLYLTKD